MVDICIADKEIEPDPGTPDLILSSITEIISTPFR